MKNLLLLTFASALIFSCANTPDRKEELKAEVNKVIEEQNLLIEELGELSATVQDDLSHQIRLKTIDENYILEGETLKTYVDDTTNLHNCKVKLKETNQKLEKITKELKNLK